jgi:hypothetical protein
MSTCACGRPGAPRAGDRPPRHALLPVAYVRVGQALTVTTVRPAPGWRRGERSGCIVDLRFDAVTTALSIIAIAVSIWTAAINKRGADAAESSVAAPVSATRRSTRGWLSFLPSSAFPMNTCCERRSGRALERAGIATCAPRSYGCCWNCRGLPAPHSACSIGAPPGACPSCLGCGTAASSSPRLVARSLRCPTRPRRATRTVAGSVGPIPAPVECAAHRRHRWYRAANVAEAERTDGRVVAAPSHRPGARTGAHHRGPRSRGVRLVRRSSEESRAEPLGANRVLAPLLVSNFGADDAYPSAGPGSTTR